MRPECSPAPAPNARHADLPPRPAPTRYRRHGRLYSPWVLVAVLAAVDIAAAATYRLWLPLIAHEDRHESPGHDGPEAAGEDHRGDHDEETPPHPGHDEATALELSAPAQQNIGLALITVQPRDFDRTITIPAVLTERPGRSEITVSAPLTGIVTRIYPLQGAAVAPTDPLFDLRLTHEDVVEKQALFLRDVEQLDIVKQEIARLEGATQSGILPGKTLLERTYEKQRLEGTLRAEREALLLHGLSAEQIAGIEKNRRLVRELVVTAPHPDSSHQSGEHQDVLQVARLAVNSGDHVATGAPLAVLTDHCELFVEGRAFEHDADELNRAANEGGTVSALIEANGGGPREVTGLRILYVENQVERESRALKFYVRLPNTLIRNEKTADGHRFIAWHYRPGQRVGLLVPVERWKNRIVLPVAAVIQDGAECYVYQQNQDHFDRVPVHVAYRDQRWAVLGNDTPLAPGAAVVAAGAYLMHQALKNKAGGGPDPHAGHQH